jgi:hypothetical protein
MRKSNPAIVVRALQTYAKHARARNMHRRRALFHQLMSFLDTMTPLQRDAYYQALIEMRAAGRDVPLVSSYKYRKKTI